jgi:hypothetical protein
MSFERLETKQQKDVLDMSFELIVSVSVGTGQ